MINRINVLLSYCAKFSNWLSMFDLLYFKNRAIITRFGKNMLHWILDEHCKFLNKNFKPLSRQSSLAIEVFLWSTLYIRRDDKILQQKLIGLKGCFFGVMYSLPFWDCMTKTWFDRHKFHFHHFSLTYAIKSATTHIINFKVVHEMAPQPVLCCPPLQNYENWSCVTCQRPFKTNSNHRKLSYIFHLTFGCAHSLSHSNLWETPTK